MLKGATVEKITPSKAKALLARNTHNRIVNDRLVAEYAKQMAAGTWELNGETIKISEDGTLIDGQHRLHACVQADTPFETYAVYSLDKNVFDTVDVGRKRTHGDMLSVTGVQNATSAAAACRWIHAYKTTKTHPNNLKISAHEVIEIYQGDAEAIAFSVTQASKVRGLAGSGPAAMLSYFINKKSVTQAAYFFDALQTGANLSAGDPILTLRNRLTKTKLMGKSRISDFEVAAMMIHSWNAFRAGNKLSIMSGTKVVGDKTPTMPAIR